MKEFSPKIHYCAHYVSKYLPLTENWIYRILINQKKFVPLMLARKKEHTAQFPQPYLFSLDDSGRIIQWVEIVIFRLIGYFPFMYKVCKRAKVQLLHVHFGYHGVKLQGLKKRLNVPMICSFYGDDAFSHPLNPGVVKDYQQLFQEADMILVLGPYMKKALMTLGCQEEKLRIHHLGIDVDTIPFQKRIIQQDQPIRFLIASSFLEKKGIDIAIQALATLKDRYSFTLDIIGDGPLKSSLLSLIDHHKMQSRVTLHGYRPYDYFIQLAQTCHVFIQASKTGAKNNKEGTPMAIVDAMATGMAIVATRHSDIPEIVQEDIHGYLAEENDVAGLTKALENLLMRPTTIGMMGEAGRNYIADEFNAAKQTKRLEELYQQLIETNS